MSISFSCCDEFVAEIQSGTGSIFFILSSHSHFVVLTDKHRAFFCDFSFAGFCNSEWFVLQFLRCNGIPNLFRIIQMAHI